MNEILSGDTQRHETQAPKGKGDGVGGLWVQTTLPEKKLCPKLLELCLHTLINCVQCDA